MRPQEIQKTGEWRTSTRIPSIYDDRLERARYVTVKDNCVLCYTDEFHHGEKACSHGGTCIMCVDE